VRTILSFGFGDGARFDALYAHLRDGNAEYLTMLAKYFGGRRAAAN
jgi:hypothetical protein